MNHGCLQNHISKRLIWVAEAGVNPAKAAEMWQLAEA